MRLGVLDFLAALLALPLAAGTAQPPSDAGVNGGGAFRLLGAHPI
jgi:hypothetical protein